MPDHNRNYYKDEGGIYPKEQGKGSGFLSNLLSFVLTFLMMYGLWLILSGKLEPLLLTLGAIGSLIVTVFSRMFLFPHPNLPRYLTVGFRFTVYYIPWLILQIFQANLHLLYLVFHPRMGELIYPHIIEFPTKLRKNLAIVTMANSITLTPGTITVTALPDGSFSVHAIDKVVTKGLPEELQNKVGRTFKEE